MATNENLQQINTFTGGMNSDVSDALLKNDQYRLARNLRLSTETDENEGELHVMQGLKHKWTIQNSTEVVAFTSCRQYIITVYKTTAGWCIGAIDTTNNNGNKCIFGPCKEELGEHLSLVTKYESDENVKLYIADGLHNILLINIRKELYKSVDEIQTDISYLDEYATSLLPPPNITIDSGSENGISGHIIGGKVQYAYTLYTEGMGETQLSSLSKVLSIYKNNTEGCAPNKESNKAVRVQIDAGNKNILNKIKIYRINYINSGEPKISIICDKKFERQDSITYIDDGSNVEDISLTEFLELLQTNCIPKLIETKDDYLFASNIKYTQDEIDKKIKQSIQDISQILKSYRIVLGNSYSENCFGEIINNRENYKPSLIPGENYRYGVVFYTKKGEKSSAFKLLDITIPEQLKDIPNIDEYDNQPFWNCEGSNINSNDFGYDTLQYKLSPIGIEFDIDFSKIPDYFQAIEIVRCENTIETRRILAHGMLGATYKSGQIYLPSHYFSRMLISKIYGRDEYTSPDIMMFACPEYSYNEDKTKELVELYKEQTCVKLQQEYEIFGKKSTISEVSDNPDYRFSSSIDQSLNYESSTIYQLGIKNSTGEFKYYGPGIFEDVPASTVGATSAPLINTYRVGVTKNIHTPSSENAWGRQQDDDVVLVNDGEIPQQILPSYICCAQLYNEKFDNSQQYNWTREGIDIEDIECTTFVNPYSFATDSKIITIDQGNSYSVGGKNFINWCTTRLIFDGKVDIDDATSWAEEGGIWNKPAKWPDVSSGGKYLLLSTQDIDDQRIVYPPNSYSGTRTWPTNKIYTVSTALLCKKNGMYGYNEHNNYYISYGNYLNRDQLSSTILIFDGDSYFNMFNFQYLHVPQDKYIYPSSTPSCYSVPLYSRIDIQGTRGKTFPQNIGQILKSSLAASYIVKFQDEPAALYGYTQTYNPYLYNNAYSKDPDVIQHYETLYTDVSANVLDCRIIVSNQKVNGEIIDNWLKFKTSNFLDVDTTFGQITNLKTFRNTLLYWQTDAFGKLSVNERQLLQAANDSQIILGTGGILDRFDYITTKYGMAMNEQADAQSSTALYWWDSNRRKILGYSEGNSPVVLQDVANMINYVNDTANKTNPCITCNVQTNDVIFNLFKTNPVVYNERMRRFISEWQVSYKYSTAVLGVVYYASGNGVYTDDGVALRPYLKYVVNKMSTYNKVFDNTMLGGRIYGGDDLQAITFKFTTPLKQEGEIQLKSDNITNREYDFRFAIPRNNNSAYGDRLRGKMMQGELSIKDIDFNPTKDFSLQYIITKYRVSWT